MPRKKDEPRHFNFNERAAEFLAATLGSMRFFWAMSFIELGWMAFMTIAHGPDRYPFAFLLFLGNQIQLYALPIFQNTQNRQSDKLLHVVTRIVALEENETKADKALPKKVAVEVMNLLKEQGYL